MASDPFDFSDVFQDLEKKIDAYMRDNTTREIASKVFAETACREDGNDLVYSLYSPGEYVRRGENGGLADWRNYETVNNGVMTITVYNNTVGNPNYAPPASEGYDEGFINDIIESGRGYWWRKSSIYRSRLPRPFMDKACDKFVDDYLMPMIHSTFFND